MELLYDGIREASRLLLSLDAMVMSAAVRTLWISVSAVMLSALIGVPLGVALARRDFSGRQAAVLAARAGMAVPTVFIGVVCYALFSRRGPLGPFELLYTGWGIMLGEMLLALPILVSLTHGAVRALDPRIGETAWMLGAGALRRIRTYLSEARSGLLLALLTAFGRCVTELGIAMIVGGNIRFRTRTLATATALETGKGEFARGMAMGLVLFVIAIGVAALMVWVSQEEKDAT